ncbi:MAG: ParB N-terminal domain-containing protein [Leptolyngbyaceae cyanobacterium bins.59]|nr:ParB N-terminal domain-containing protein [Leptolyngbyaceae cyanobacterium bins.59]
MTNLDKIIAAARSKQGQQTPPLKAQESAFPLEQIQPRQEDTRPLNPAHVEALSESIAVLNLIEPLVVDKKGRLLAGGHRLAAIKLLKERQADKFQANFPGEAIPVRTLLFDAEEEPDLALQIEVAENEQRRDYTPSEVKTIAERLRSAGYVDVKGRPRKGQKALMPALAVVVGKHLRTVQRYLSDEEERKGPDKSTTRVVLLRQALPKLLQWQQSEPQSTMEEELAKRLPEVIGLIKEILEEE